MKANIGIDQKGSQQVCDCLAKLLANTYLLYLKTQNFHWNVRGEDFYEYHIMFEKQYTMLAEAVDEIAERIRALDFVTPASFAQFLQLTTLKETTGTLSSQQMLQQLLADHEQIIREGREMIKTAQGVNDEGSADLVIERLREHEKTAWMLRAFL